MRRLIRILFPFVLVAVAANPCRAGEALAAERATLIDRQIDARLRSEGVRAAEWADDAQFVRRIHLDLHGTVPALEQTRRFLADAGPDKRARLVDSLLADARYGQYLADIWQGYLMSPFADDQTNRAERFRDWLAEQFNTRRWDQIVTDVITASGKMEENAAVTWLIEGRLPRAVPDLTDLTSRFFIGVRLNCAQCHDHPFVDWKRQDYWGMAAFFTQIQTPGKPKMVYKSGLLDNPQMTLASCRDADTIEGYQSRPPTFLGGGELKAEAGQTHRAALARWITSPENPYFARATVNRMWSHFFGRGIVNPVD